MINTDEEIQTLTGQLNDLSIKIGVLAVKHEAAAATAKKFHDVLKELNAKHREITQQLHELERHKSGMYMWENIGDGG